jgi:hypothetical protein
MVVDPRDQRHNEDGSLKPQFYDPSVLSDNTGMRFKTASRNVRDWNKAVHALMQKPRKLECPKCGGDRWIIIADDHPKTGLVAFRCSNSGCREGIPPVEMRKPQMQDATARGLGLWVPNSVDVGGIDDQA